MSQNSEGKALEREARGKRLQEAGQQGQGPKSRDSTLGERTNLVVCKVMPNYENSRRPEFKDLMQD